jgi:hypothetical protein
MATISANFSAKTALTITLASLASSSTGLVGVESNEVNNTSNKYIDALLDGFITVGTSPAANTQVNVFVWGGNVSLATKALDTLDGTGSAETITSTGVSYGILKLLKSLTVDAATSNVRYDFGCESLRAALGTFVLPPFWGVFVTQNTGAALNSTGGNHDISYVGVKFDVA